MFHRPKQSNSIEADGCFFVDLLPQLRMYFEGLDGGPTQDRVCRGNNENDNFGSYFTVYWTSTLEGCKSQCVEIAECKGTPGSFVGAGFCCSGLPRNAKKMLLLFFFRCFFFEKMIR